MENSPVAFHRACRLMEAARVAAALTIVSGADPIAAMQDCSQEAALVLKGFELPNETDERQALKRIRVEIGELRRVILVYSAGGHSRSA